MTAKTIFSKIKAKFVLLLALICVFTFSAFLFTACGSEEKDDTETETTYSKQETDTADINNGSFEFGLADVELKDFPKTSITGWSSVSTENSSESSKMPSGVIDTETNNYKKILGGLLDNSTYLTYAETKFNFKKSQIVADKATANTDKSEKEIEEIAKAYIVDTYLLPAYPNPGVHDGAKGSHVLMINNYTNEVWNTAQYITSVSTITLEKGTYGKISFYVNASNLVGYGDYFLNARIEGSVNAQTQAPYILKGINNTNGWKQYSIYVKADSDMTTTVTLSLALGYCNKEGLVTNNVVGTAFIDDVVYEEVAIEDVLVNNVEPLSVVFNYNSDKVLSESVQQDKYAYFYSLVAEESETYKTNTTAYTLTDAQVTGDFLYSNTINGTTVDKFGAENSKGSVVINEGVIKFDNLLNASYFAKISIPGLFKVQNEEYFYISFDIENKLNRLNSTDVTVFVVDKDGKEHSVNNFNTANETKRCHLLVKNDTPSTSSITTETFDIMIIVGLTNITNSNVQSSFATGNVMISNVKMASGKSYQFEKDATGNPKVENGQKQELEGYDFYSYLSSVGSSVSIDTHSTKNNDTYALSASNSSTGGAVNKVSNINGYTGVEPNHTYIKEDSSVNVINDRSGSGNDYGLAGLINSKYLNNYTDLTIDEKASIASALNYIGEKSIQPIMVYNKTANAYGFLGNSFSIAESANAKISVKVRVTGEAKAFIYVVDTSIANKPIAELSFEKGNVAGDVTYDKAFSQKLSFEGITADNMDSNGWLTLTFYIANGASAKNLRLELWNGSRDGQVKSQGYVFFAFDSFIEGETFVSSTLTGAFNEPATIGDAYTTLGNPLYDGAFTQGFGREFIDTAIKYQRKLDAIEIKYNSEDPDKLVSYDPTYVWAKALTLDGGAIYAIYNTIDPVAIDPYANEDDSTEEKTGCLATTDPSTFWLSFSSILLGVVIVFALIALVLKQVHRRRVANKKDGVSHYKVTSRIKTAKKVTASKKEDLDDLDDYNESIEDSSEETVEETTEEVVEETVEETTEDYVYGDVQDFGSEESSDSEKSE